MSKVEGYSLWYNNLGQDPSRDFEDNNLMEFYFPYTHFYQWENKCYAEFIVKTHPNDIPLELECDYEKDEATKTIITVTFTLGFNNGAGNEAPTKGWNILYFDWIDVNPVEGYSFTGDTKIVLIVEPPQDGSANTEPGGSSTVRYGDVPGPSGD